ncbi:PD-(D/E)XK nuclease family protein [Haloplanus halobius]|uniref:PD-(D/E)XK nuclease family protein n=1 Tax=Haloplanus halobius TaxID=2934938 RepID=UPI00200E6752|nr:PD-(D/E)XK nuclease family protein [Haloplanus sp. XH21]
MKIEQGTAFETVGEHEIDFSVAQLVESSDSFSRWFVSQANPAIELGEYIGGVIHASYAGEGESDIEFGFLTETGDRYIMLVENKIDADKQPNQIERYYNRGQFRVEHDDWDSYTVCLLAPERYVSEEDETGFDSIIYYEDVLEQLGNLTYDGGEFLQSVFEAALTKSRASTTADATDTLRAIENRFQNETDIPHLERDPEYTGYNKRTSFKSTHPEHHDAIRYDIFVGEIGDAGRTTVRLQIKSIDGLTEEERDSLKSIAPDNKEILSSYKWRLDRKVNIASKKVGHEAVTRDGSYDTYVDAIVDELLTLTDTFHPIYVGESI